MATCWLPERGCIIANFRVPGPVTVKFNGVPLGSSKAGVVVRTRTSWAPITDDEHGTEPADFIFTGKAAQVEIAGVNTVDLLAANIWGSYGGLLMGVTNCLLAIGALASVLGKQLDLVEREGTTAVTWTALTAVPLDPDAMTLTSITELSVPATFLIVPYAGAGVNYGKLFSNLPDYLVA